MGDETDADRIQRDRERRRAAERTRVEQERRGRQLELARLRLLDEDHVVRSESTPGTAAPTVEVPVESAGPPAVPDARPEPAEVRPLPSTTPSSAREVGGPISPDRVRDFLALDPAERFDIQVLNSTSFAGLASQIAEDTRLLRDVATRAEMLMVRVKQEVDDALSAGAFLRERVLEWYRLSPTDPQWATRTPPRWAGLFADSRVSGGKLVPWLNTRLWALREACARARGISTRIRRGLLRDRGAEAAVSRTAAQQIQAEVAQAVLDDLAGRPRDPEATLPLVRVSELAVRRQVQTVNDALAALFASPETGPFVILHPNRYPDCEELDIRPPTPTASGAALAYALAPVRSSRRPTRPASSSSLDDAPRVGGTEREEGSQEELDATTIWDADSVSAATWVRIVDERRRERHRLDSPPKEYRNRAAWTVLRSLVLENPDFRKAFLAAKWRGRPSGLPLLAQLLHKGTFAPEVSTDHEYLEAELGELAQGDPQWRPTDAVWHVEEWKITREGTHQEGYRYRAEEGRTPKS